MNGLSCTLFLSKKLREAENSNCFRVTFFFFFPDWDGALYNFIPIVIEGKENKTDTNRVGEGRDLFKRVRITRGNTLQKTTDLQMNICEHLLRT